jgi:alanyl-tRNA synthetase
MKSSAIRSTFLGYFEGLGHRVVPSSSLVPAGDPTLFFANAGMNQFKDVFTGQARRDYVRAASVQKCMRVSGKHNDFETVGRSRHHHTFFEMLGNFSFGDYFKAEAIEWAWRLVTEKLELAPDRIVATVFEDDDEAASIWTGNIGLSADRVYRLGMDENYWSMGETGPQGPCSEMYVDFGAAAGCGTKECDPACACGRYLEFWNLVFMQYERDASGKVTRLPRPSIDTGMGLDRMSQILQGVGSNYETDLFQPIMAVIAQRSGRRHEPLLKGREAAWLAEDQVSMRVVADHVRALTFLVADGVFPSNEGRGYVLRKILRRAAGHGARIGLEAPFLSELSATVVETFGGAYPELPRERERVRATLQREEIAFQATLAQGREMLDTLTARLSERGGREIPGADAFRLHDTHGLPLELTVELARERGLSVDRQGFEKLLDEQKERARAAARSVVAPPTLPADLELPRTEFRGYSETSTAGCRVLAVLAEGAVSEGLSLGAEGWIVLDRTPFYAESGGQVGDEGTLRTDAMLLCVLDTQALRPGVTGHFVRVEQGAVRRGDALLAEVDAVRRRRIMANHTATHLLHAALKEVLGETARQAGSLVAPDRLRFDFTASEPPTKEQLRDIERRVNEKVFAHVPVTKREMAYQQAVDSGAVAMFGEKYGDTVRVVDVGAWSVELCGGTHCDRTEQIGGLRIVSERGVASGVRRVEAVTGPGLFERLSEDEDLIGALEGALKAPRGDLVASVQRLGDHVKQLRRDLEESQRQAATGAPTTGTRSQVAGVTVETRLLQGLDVTALREVAEGLREQAGVAALALGSAKDGKAALVVTLARDLAERGGADFAKQVVAEMAKEVSGGGGGRTDMGWAGGKNANGVEAALARFPALLGERLSRTQA